MAKLCCVCGESKENPDNRLFTCKGHGCDVTVHQACYGIVVVPSGQWFCRKCESQERAARVRCELCPRKEGALKRTDSAGWAHVVCALYIPEVTFGNTMKMEPIVTSKLPRERFTKSCYLCEEQGLESQATYGACMSCHKSSCRLSFHVTCAQREHLLCEEEDPRDQRNIIYCGYCHVHLKKMIRQKYKQSLRKVGTTPTTTTAPPLPLSPPHLPLLSPPPSSLVQKDVPHKHKAKERDKDNEREHTLPLKRQSTDAPLPPGKRRNRKRKFSSSNDSSASEAPSIASDINPHVLPVGATIAGSPRFMASGSPHFAASGSLAGANPEVISMATSVSEHAANDAMGVREVLGAEPMKVGQLSTSPVAATLSGASQDPIGAPTRLSGSSSSDQSLTSRAQVPPLSLHELLERQWEQTAQLILDQAGKQNNAGVMLAHLHELQSENRRMQSRIMELASQREFYIATNTRLRQTLSESDVSRLPNGVQPPADGIQPALQTDPVSSTSASSLMERLTASSSGGDSQTHTPVISSSLPKAAQDSLLHAHFLQHPPSNRGSWSTQASTTPSLQSPESMPSGIVNQIQRGADPWDTRLPSTLATEPGDKPGGTVHDITQVTSSIQAPITTHTPLPRPGQDTPPRHGSRSLKETRPPHLM